MEKKQGFFSALKEEVVRGLSPSRSRSRSRSGPKSPARSASPISGILRFRKHHVAQPEPMIPRSGSLRPAGETLTPLMEGPDTDGCDGADGKKERWGQWMKGQLSSSSSSAASSSANRRSDLRLLLGVMGAPLGPVHVSAADPLPHLSIKDTPIVSLSLSLMILSFLSCNGGDCLMV